jgi:hypothetical protein
MQIIPTPTGPIRRGYLLLDASNVDDETFDDLVPMVPCTPVLLSQSEHLMPRLIDVAALSSAQQDGLGDVLVRELNGNRPPVVCAWLDSPLDAEVANAKTLKRHLTRYLVGRDPVGDTVFWRYFDPRVFSILMNVFSAEQTQALLGPVRQWRFPWCRRWWSVSGTGLEPDLLLGNKPAWPSKNQWSNVENSELITSVFMRLQDTLPANQQLTDVACLQLQKTIHTTIQNARKYLHLDDQDALTEYALHVVRYGDDFRQHPKLASAWDELAQRRTNWSATISRLEDSDYRLLDKYSPIPPILQRSE